MNTDRPSRTYRRENPSFFFPVLLIAVGAIWLLVNNGTIPVENVYRLAPFWPVLLIIAGISLMLQRLWWPLSALLWLGTAAAVIGLLLFAPSILPQARTFEYKQETFTEPLESAKSAEVNLNLSRYPTNIRALESSDNLIEADVTYVGTMQFSATGSDQKTIRLDHNSNDQMWFFDGNIFSGEARDWEIGLTPEIPLRLRIDSGSGSGQFNLDKLQIESLTVDSGSGSVSMDLPANAATFPFSLNVGSGSVTIRGAEGTGFDLDVDGGSGSLSIDVPDGAGVQVEVRNDGSGSLNLPDGFSKVRGDVNEDEGTWENKAYATSETKITITLDIGSGSITVR